MAEPLKATFFTLKHRDRAVLLPATLAMIVFVALIVAAWVGFNWGTLAQLFELSRQAGAQPDEAEAARLFAGGMGMVLSAFLFLFPLYIAIASYEAACLRWMIRGEAPGLFGLALDNDTWRVWGVYWCWLVANMAVGFATSLLTMPFVFMMMGDVYAQGGDPSEFSWDLQLRIQALSMLQYIPLAFIGVRLGPAAATSIARRRFSFFEAWTVTSDRFWSLLGSWALLWLIFGVLYVALFGVTYGALFGDLVPRIQTAWPDFPPVSVDELSERIFSQRGLALIGAAYAGFFAIWILYALMSFGVNARAALAALEDGKIQEVAPES
jgi:hypothetical protein